MATLNRTFSVKNGVDVANTIIIDSSRNISNIVSANITQTLNAATVNVTTANIAETARANLVVSTRTALAAPNTGHTHGERLRLFDFNNPGQPNYAIGVESNHIWSATDDNTGTTGFKWYGNTTQAAILKSNGTLELANTIVAKNFLTTAGLNVTNQANTARDTANGAYAQANGAYSQANGAYSQANGAYSQANGAYSQANGAYAQANGAYAQANGAYSQANSAANTVRVYANSAGSFSNKFLNFVNTASIQVTVGDAGDGNANISFTTTGAAVADAYAQANAAYGQANTARGTANDAYAQANTARGTANDSYAQANAGYAQANTARGTANDAYGQANTARTTANDAYAQANTARGTANDAYGQANAAYGQANAAYGQANAAYGAANLKLNISGGTITGSLVVQGNLEVLGNSTTLNVETLAVEDNEIILNSNVTGAPALDGFITINRGASTNAVLKWDEAADQWKWADGEGTFYAFDTALDAYASANLGFAQANTARGTANDAYAQANAGYAQANTARGTANDAYAQANAGYAQANTARNTANDAYAQANTARTTANDAYGQANAGYAQANTARATANDAYAQANAAYNHANTKVSKSGDTMTGNLTITTAGIGLTVANANVTYSLRVGSLNVTTNTVTTSNSGQVVLDVFPATQLASAKYFIQSNSATDYHTTEMVLVQDATNVWITEYGSIQTGPSLGTFSADISSGDVRLLFNATNNINTIRAVRYGIVP